MSNLMIFSVPCEGTFVSKYQVKSAGPYLLGPTFGFSPVSSIGQCLARKKETDKFFTLKVNMLPNKYTYTSLLISCSFPRLITDSHSL